MVVFVFVDMFVLIVLYTYLFLYLQIQSKKLRFAESTTHHSGGEPGTYELESGLVYNSLTKPLPPLPHQRPQIRRVQSKSNASPDRRLRRVSVTLLCYPVLYLIFLMPLSIARLREFSGLNPSLTFTYAAAAVFDCQGFVNVILYTSTRRGLVTWNALLPGLLKRLRRHHPESSKTPPDSGLTRKFTSRDSVISTASLNHPPPVPEKTHCMDEHVLDYGSSCDRDVTQSAIGGNLSGMFQDLKHNCEL